MNDKQYYVKLNVPVYGIKQELWMDRDGMFCTKMFRALLTKSELAEIENGALYKFKWRDLRHDIELGDGWTMQMDWNAQKSYWEWINPLIKLESVLESE